MTKARRVNGRNDLWEIHVDPSGSGDVSLTLRQRGDLRRVRRHLHGRRTDAVQPTQHHRIRPGQLAGRAGSGHRRPPKGQEIRPQGLSCPCGLHLNTVKPASSMPIDAQWFAVERYQFYTSRKLL